MHIKTVTTVGFTILSLLAAACGGAPAPETKKTVDNVRPGPSGGSGAGGATDDDEDDDPADATTTTACVVKGDKGNAAGVGAYCDATTKCAADRICTADFGAPEGAHFCTKMCSTDADCGDGATCFAEARGKGCVPNACKQ